MKLKNYGIDVIERVPLEVGSNPANVRYLETKQEKMGHLLDLTDLAPSSDMARSSARTKNEE